MTLASSSPAPGPRVALALVLGLAGCGKRGAAPATGDDARGKPIDASTATATPPPAPVPAPPPGRPPLPADHAAPTAEQVALGALLFHERRLAADGTTRCATCHDPEHGLGGPAPRSQNALGKTSPRRTPTLFDLAWHPALGWDGRGADRLRYVMGHATSQLGTSLDDSARRLLASPTYRAAFARAGGGEPGHIAGVALVAYATTRFSPEAPWEQHLRGVAGAVADAAIAGAALFEGKAGCAPCHPAPLYTDLGYHRLGLVASPDDGRGRLDPAATGAFKTPTLRQAAARAFFFHDGSAATLAAAIDWHLAGGTGQGATATDVDPALPPIALSADERAALLAFVSALTAPLPPTPAPAMPQDLP